MHLTHFFLINISCIFGPVTWFGLLGFTPVVCLGQEEQEDLIRQQIYFFNPYIFQVCEKQTVSFRFLWLPGSLRSTIEEFVKVLIMSQTDRFKYHL